MSSLRLANTDPVLVPLPAPTSQKLQKNSPDDIPAMVGEKLTMGAFLQLSGQMAGYPFVKIVVDRENNTAHFLQHSRYPFHVDYVAERIMGITIDEMLTRLDEINHDVYQNPQRRCFLGTVALHKREDKKFFTLETVEVDTMDVEMLKSFYDITKSWMDPSLPLLIKPANHQQEAYIADLDPSRYPRVFNHELFSSANFIALREGVSRGRLRAFRNEKEYRDAFRTIEWYDIICMPKVPEDIPHVAGIINAAFTTPLSHTNVLAHGWQIPNSVEIDALDLIEQKGLNGKWVEYQVDRNASAISLTPTEAPSSQPEKPLWRVHQIQIEEPETENTPIVSLEELRASDRIRYGTKAANIGEMHHVLNHGSERLLGFYRIKRPPRENLLPYLAQFLGVPETMDLAKASWDFLKAFIRIPRGLAIPFAVQQKFLQSSPQIQQGLGKIKMALELNSSRVDALCCEVQGMIRNARIPDDLREYIDNEIATHLGGVSSFVVRSSSNAEDLEGFSAAGIYESKNHITTADNIFKSIKEVWASLLSPRTVRLRQDVGISLDDSYMGVIVQEEAPSEMGGVLVTTNPTDPERDFRNVYVNVSAKSVNAIVEGADMPFQYLFNTVEGNGRTLSIGEAKQDLPIKKKEALHKLAFACRLFQSHFSPDYTFSHPIDVEWVYHKGDMYMLQLRPYAR